MIPDQYPIVPNLQLNSTLASEARMASARPMFFCSQLLDTLHKHIVGLSLSGLLPIFNRGWTVIDNDDGELNFKRLLYVHAEARA